MVMDLCLKTVLFHTVCVIAAQEFVFTHRHLLLFLPCNLNSSLQLQSVERAVPHIDILQIKLYLRHHITIPCMPEPSVDMDM